MIVMMWAKLRIRSRLSALLAAISFAVPATYVFAAEARSEQVALQSATYADFRQLLSREAPTAANTVPAVLSFPEQARDRFPAVVVVHTVGGYRDDNEGQYAAELRRAGFG